MPSPFYIGIDGRSHTHISRVSDLASAAPLPATSGLDGALLARPSLGSRSNSALLTPLGADGWVLVEVDDDDGPTNQQPPEEGEEGRWAAALAPALESLRVSLSVVGRERAAGQRAQGTFRRLLREVGGCEGWLKIPLID